MKYTENGYEYYDYVLTDGKDIISKYSIISNIGFRGVFSNIFVLDVFWGLGYSFSEKKSVNPNLRKYTRISWDYEYNGLFPVLGLKFGAYLK